MSQNLAPCPYGWGGYATYGRLMSGQDPQIVFIDPAVLSPSGNPTIRAERHVEGVDTILWRSVATSLGFTSVKAGERIYFSSWIKTGPAVNANAYLHGGLMAFDFYGIKDSDGSRGRF